MLGLRDREKGYYVSLALGVMVGFVYYSIQHPPQVSIAPTNTTYFRYLESLYRAYLPSEKSKEAFKYVKEDETLLKRNGTRVLCIIFSHLNAFRTKADHAYDVWAHKCDYAFVASEKPDPTGKLPVMTLNIDDTYQNLWWKTKASFSKAWELYKDKVDWFVKSDDDTFMIVENLKLLLSSYDPETPIWFGCKSRAIVQQGYMSGGAGYILSREATRRFVEEALEENYARTDKTCPAKRIMGAEDAQMGLCLEAVNVTAGDSRDYRGRDRFLPVPFEHFLNRPVVSARTWWLMQRWLYYAPDEWRCCSTTPVSCHYVSPHRMRLYDYIVYRLHAHGHARTIYMERPPDKDAVRGWVG